MVGGLRNRKRRSWNTLSKAYKKGVMTHKVIPLMKQVKAVVGSCEGMDDVMGTLIKTRSLKKRNRGVTAANCLFSDPAEVVRVAGYTDRVTKTVRAEMKASIDVHRLMVLFDEHGGSEIAYYYSGRTF